MRGRIDWKYALCLELDDPGFHSSVGSEFRARLLAGGAEGLLFARLLAEAARAHATVVFTHEPFPPWGRILQAEEGYHFERG